MYKILSAGPVLRYTAMQDKNYGDKQRRNLKAKRIKQCGFDLSLWRWCSAPSELELEAWNALEEYVPGDMLSILPSVSGQAEDGRSTHRAVSG